MISRDQLIERINGHGHDKFLTPDEVRQDFGDVIRMLVPPGADFDPHTETCCTTTDPDLSLRVVGDIVVKGEYVGIVERCIHPEHRYAEHELLSLEHKYREKGFAPLSLWQTINLYDEVGIDQVYLQAGLSTGRHYWARYGFDFELGVEREFVKDWFAEILEELGHPGLSDNLHSAYALHGVGASSDVTVSIRQVEMAILERGLLDENEYLSSNWKKSLESWDPQTTAEQNSLDIHEPIELGKAIFLLLPISWHGVLDLTYGPQRQVFWASLLQRLAQLARP